MKILFVLFVALLVIAVVFVVFFNRIDNMAIKHIVEDMGPADHKAFNQYCEQNNLSPKHVGTVDFNNWRTQRAIELNGLVSLMKISKAFNQYCEQNDHLPKSFNWCDKLMEYYEEEGLTKKYLFNIPQLGTTEYHFAFNNNLSLLSRKDLPSNLVLVFEADGKFNLSGGAELLKRNYAKNRYFSVENKYIYVLFLDGTIAKYRLHDGAIAIAKEGVYEASDYSNFCYTYEEENSFLSYYKKGETPYSPLNWESK